MAIKCIALDLDGTTLDQDGRLPEANRKAMEDAITQGIEIVIASGRAYDTLPQEVLSIKGIGWAITSNGAAVYRVPEGEAAFRSTLPPEVAEELLACTANENINYETFVGGNAYTDRKMYDDPMAYGCTEYGAKYLRSTRKPVPDIRDFILEHCTELDSIELVTIKRSGIGCGRCWSSAFLIYTSPPPSFICWNCPAPAAARAMP